MNVEKVCRVCLSEFDELTPLGVKLPGENKTLEETINFVVNINIKLKDGLPDKICKICESILDLADTFKQRCLESESILEQKAQEKQSDEFLSKCSKNRQENSEKYSENASSSFISKPHTSLTNPLTVITESTENIYDFSEHKIKMEIEEHHVDAGVTMSEQEYLVTIKEEIPEEPILEPCLIKEEVSAEFIKDTYNKELFSCSHCNLTFESKMLYKVHILLVQSSFIHNKDAPSSKEPKLDDMQPTTAAVRSPTEHPAAADTSTDTIIKTEHDLKKIRNIIRKKMHDKNLKLKHKGANEISKVKIKKESTKDTATMLKLSGTNTDDKITGATETQSKCFSNKVTGTTATCDICGYTTTAVRYLNAHLKAHAATKRYSCDSCLYLTVNLGNFKEHLQTHSDDKSYSYFLAHLKRHAGETQHSCKVCEKKFNKKSDLLRHERTHTGEKPYSCDICGRKVSQKNDLVSHMRTHTGERPYSCEECERKFINKGNLLRHKLIHTQEKPYPCNACEKKFSYKQSLLRHITTHTGEKAYSCNLCEKKFIHKKNLDIHVRTHTGNKTYSCNICERKFIRKHNFMGHLSTHTMNDNDVTIDT